MWKYPMRVRVWGLLTVGLAIAWLIGDHRHANGCRESLWRAFLDLASGKEDLTEAGPVAAFTAKLALFAGVSAWIMYASATVLALMLSRRPRSDQAADYDDGPTNL